MELDVSLFAGALNAKSHARRRASVSHRLDRWARQQHRAFEKVLQTAEQRAVRFLDSYFGGAISPISSA
jgi:hypothetical protein